MLSIVFDRFILMSACIVYIAGKELTDRHEHGTVAADVDSVQLQQWPSTERRRESAGDASTKIYIDV